MASASRGVKKRFGTTPVLRGVSATLAPGEFLSLVGPSGCGKTTLLRILAGLEAADAGTVSMGGRDVTRLRPADRDVAMVFQNYALYPHLTVGQNVAVPLAMRRLSVLERLPLVGRLVPGQAGRRRAIAADVQAAAETLRIGHLLDRRPAQLSGGQRQRVALGRVLVRRPAAFLMDEPLSNLDAELRAQTRKEIVELHRRAGVTTVYVTHDQVEAMTMSDRVALMLDGHILQLGTPRAMYDDPSDLRVAAFLGSPRINTLAAMMGPYGVTLAGELLPVQAATAPGTPVTLGLRAELLRLAPSGLPVLVEHVEFLGAEVLVHARTRSGEGLVARMTAEAAGRVQAGDRAHLAVDWPGVLLFGADGTRLTMRPAVAHV
jgi:multiple sugar transport system ATP-binding protein